jgi:transcription elongation factor Elf1
MTNLSGVIIMEGDTNIARLFCGQCGKSFRANINRVASIQNVPFCRKCIDNANVLRKDRGMSALQYDPSAYYSNDHDESEY